MPTQNNDNKGIVGERVIAQFFDSHYSKLFSFPNPKTKSNEQVADVLVWMNRVVFLIEVKTRDEGTASIDSWARSNIQKAVEQITKNHRRIKTNEVINLHNSYYHTTLDCSGVTKVIGLIVLIHDEKCAFLPSNAISDIYDCEFPIHIISWNELRQMTGEIDTVPDFVYYLNDRSRYLKTADIPLGVELNVLGYYKTQSNKFPEQPVDFAASPFWETYHTRMAGSIAIRAAHNEHSIWLDKLGLVFSDQRRLFHGHPLGLYFSWEIGSISRRERAYLGKKLDSVQRWFEKGNSTRRFAWLNDSTGNWLVFYYSKSEPKVLHKELYRMVELKLIKEVHEASFNYGAYGFGFQVSELFPPRLLGLASAVVIGADVVEGKYTQADIEEAHRHFGDKSARQVFRIEEFPKE